MEYTQFIEQRRFTDVRAGFKVAEESLTACLKPHQKYLVRWACLKGRAAIFADTGLGKTRILSEWARLIAAETGGRVIVLSPLAVAQQTVGEAATVGIKMQYCRHDNGAQFVITNYEMIGNFDFSNFVGVVLDESSILKNFEGRTRAVITEACSKVPYRLSCTATPSPNDHMELGTQAEFLGVMPRSEMLAMFFTHDGSSTSQWALKGHGRSRFWEWLSTWAAVLRSPADIGLDGSEYVLPPLEIHYHELPAEGPIAASLTERREAKRASMADRVGMAAMLANCTDEPVIVWCHMNDESAQLAAAIPDAVEVKGADHVDVKERRLIEFSIGAARVMVTKPSIAGFGMNWQHCNTVIYAGLTDSFEEFYQAIRRCYRFGQTRPVTVHCLLASTERNVVENLKRKERQHNELSAELMTYMAKHVEREVVGTFREYSDHNATQAVALPSFI